MKKKDNLVWMDLEFTGLSDEQIIIETACIITDKNLNILEEGPNIVVHRTSDELKIIEDWPLKTHTESGLLEKVKNSETDIHQADELNVQFISKWVGKNQSRCPKTGPCSRVQTEPSRSWPQHHDRQSPPAR